MGAFMSELKLLAVLVKDEAFTKRDFNQRLHCSDGPAARLVPEDKLNDQTHIIDPEDELTGQNIYIWHGIRLPSTKLLCEKHGLPTDLVDRLIYKKVPITADWIDSIPSVEIRRVAIEIFGLDNYIENGKFVLLDEDFDKYGRKRQLFKKEMQNDDPIMVCTVTNSTPEGKYEFSNEVWNNLNTFPEAHRARLVAEYQNTKDFKEEKGQFFLRVTKESGEFIPFKDNKGNLVYRKYNLLVHHELRPLMTSGDFDSEGQPVINLGEPQKPTCRNAVASSFGLYGEEYEPDEET